MKRETTNQLRGFTLVELMIAMAVGLVVMAAATQLFKSGMDATLLVTEQAEMQQNVRSALNLIAKDVSMAGAGMPPGGLNLPYGAGAVASTFACNQTPTCYVTSNTYPTGTIGTPATTVTNFMFALLPGPARGMEKGSWTATIPATGTTPDSITSIYVDYSFPLSDYAITFPAAPTGSFVNVGATPAGDPAIMSPTGIKAGDLILLSNPLGSAIGEVTTPAANKITFADSDALKINQTGAAQGNIKNISGGSPTKAYRLQAVTYFIEVPTVASGLTPRLMRQVNGQSAVAVADNIIDLQFTYDACDNTNSGGASPTCAAMPDPIGNAPSYSPNQIHKVNIQVVGQSLLGPGKKSRSMALVTSVSTRNLSFRDHF